MTGELPCGSCATLNDASHAYCSACGTALAANGGPPSARAQRGYRGPRVVLVAGLVLFTLGAAAAGAAFASVQASGDAGFALDIGGPTINAALGWVGIDQVEAPTGEERETSIALLGVFILGCLIAAAGGLLALWGAIWLLLRWSPQGRRHAEAARPQLERAAQRGRKTFDEKIHPRSQELLRKSGPVAKDAAARGRERIARAAAARRDRTPDP